MCSRPKKNVPFSHKPGLSRIKFKIQSQQAGIFARVMGFDAATGVPEHVLQIDDFK